MPLGNGVMVPKMFQRPIGLLETAGCRLQSTCVAKISFFVRSAVDNRNNNFNFTF